MHGRETHLEEHQIARVLRPRVGMQRSTISPESALASSCLKNGRYREAIMVVGQKER